VTEREMKLVAVRRVVRSELEVNAVLPCVFQAIRWDLGSGVQGAAPIMAYTAAEFAKIPHSGSLMPSRVYSQQLVEGQIIHVVCPQHLAA